jgi:hypothetical protein
MNTLKKVSSNNVDAKVVQKPQIVEILSSSKGEIS